jgi:Ca-activated chloride channel family protein
MHRRSKEWSKWARLVLTGAMVAMLLPCAKQSRAQTVSTAAADSAILPGGAGDDAGRWPQVRMEVRLISKMGDGVSETDAKNIRVFDNGLEAKEASVDPERMPLSICLVIDESGSLYDSAPLQVMAARAVIAAMQPRDEMAVVVFNDRGMLKQDFTSDATKLERPIEDLKFWGPSNFFDTIIATTDRVFSRSRYTSRILLVLSDGGNNHSTSNLRQTIDKLSTIDGPTVYSMTMQSSEEDKRGFKNLQEITEATGGDAIKIKNAKKVSEAVQMLMRVAHDRYVVVYTPSQQLRDGSLHKVEVKMDKLSGSTTKIMVVSRRAYYAPER